MPLTGSEVKGRELVFPMVREEPQLRKERKGDPPPFREPAASHFWTEPTTVKNDRHLAFTIRAILALMQRTIVCPGCDERLTAAATAMRRHATVMHAAIEVAKGDSLPEELRKNFTEKLRATLNDAQSAWDAYRSHLIEHGLLSALHSRDVA